MNVAAFIRPTASARQFASRILAGSCNRLQARAFATEEEDDGLPQDYKKRTISVATRRIDRVLKRTSNISGTALDKAFMQNCVRVNEQIVKKKHAVAEPDDEIELWLQPYAENQDLAEVHKVRVDDFRLTDNGYSIDVKIWKSVIVPNWRRS